MNTEKVRAALFAGMFCVVTGLGLSACNEGTEPGETNVERSGIEYPEEELKQSKKTRDTADYEHHYDHADHPDSTAIGDGAYLQDGKRNKRP